MRSSLPGAFPPIPGREFRRLIPSRRMKILFLVTFFPALVYLISPNAAGRGVEATLESFETPMVDLLSSYWLGIIGGSIILVLPLSGYW